MYLPSGASGSDIRPMDGLHTVSKSTGRGPKPAGRDGYRIDSVDRTLPAVIRPGDSAAALGLTTSLPADRPWENRQDSGWGCNTLRWNRPVSGHEGEWISMPNMYTTYDIISFTGILEFYISISSFG
jgi:hypothetical protein